MRRQPITAFIDTEIDPVQGKILDIGGIKSDGSIFHSSRTDLFTAFLHGSDHVCGHNIFTHDLKYINSLLHTAGIDEKRIIDTLFLSPLLFPARPYHSLLKDDKLQSEELNNPLNDSIKVRDLFYDEQAAFAELDEDLKNILYLLLHEKKEFSAFFDLTGYQGTDTNVGEAIRKRFHGHICMNSDLEKMIQLHPVELAYCLSLINVRDRYSITPRWVLRRFPSVENLMYLLRNRPCITGCGYCNESLDVYKGLKKYFGFESFRSFNGQPLQEDAARHAVYGGSLLAIFPTGGGKSLTFQLPALMSGAAAKGLTVVISPLQSLMKDQVDNLEKADITEAVTINGLLDPIERAKSIERVIDGSASILYISPESLRSKTIEHILLGRNIVRFVVDEAHCLSSWGHDFRVDYLYIADFIKSLQEKKNIKDPVPVSCFTATAKQKVIEDICEYFGTKLSLDLKVFNTGASRSNLHYRVFVKETDEEKYNMVRDLIEEKDCPAIIYVSRTLKAYQLAKRLSEDGYPARPYHGKMEKREKTENQDSFIRGEVGTMVATSAFGMGVDKKDVGMVIHYDISDSLENYIQEAGRAGRDEAMTADCYVLFNDEDLCKHFILLNQTKLNFNEIQQIWKAIKELTRFRMRVSQSALEIARKAGWEEGIHELETRVTTAIAALEDAGYLKRGQNMPRIYADSILSRNALEAIDKINSSDRFDQKQKENAVRIIRKLISSKSRSHLSDEGAESRVDYISDQLAIPKEDVIMIIYLLREERILADAKELAAYIRKKENADNSLSVLRAHLRTEEFLLSLMSSEEKVFHIKEMNELAAQRGYLDVDPGKIRTIINFWAIKNWIRRQKTAYSKNHVSIRLLHDKKILEEKLASRIELSTFIIKYLYDNCRDEDKNEILTDFSVLELKEAYQAQPKLIDQKICIDKDIRKRYKVQDYKKLDLFYENKTQQIHIVGEYARKMISDYIGALRFVDDYFQLNYPSFLKKYFNKAQMNELQRNITPRKFRQLFGELSTAQLAIINDSRSKHIVVAAGPGSGKTRVLVHKLASLMLMEDIRHDQLLMVTFSRAAATEFKKRLMGLIGNAANFVDIKTFHSYCFDLLGRVGSIEKSEGIIREATKKIMAGEIETGKITKSVLVIDEAQDMTQDEFLLISALMKKNEDMRVIAVGDDDQNIYSFRGSDPKYLLDMITEKQAVMYELVENYRSKKNLVEFTNKFVERIPDRLKKTPIQSMAKDIGDISVFRHYSTNLIAPVADDILTAELKGTTCVLTKTNEEALQIFGLLIKNDMPAKLIQSNDGFDLFNLLEIRTFFDMVSDKDTPMISEDIWADAKRKLADLFINSFDLDMCMNLINDFEEINPKYRYVSDLEIYIRESRFEDFYREGSETISISTIHKAKGHEFDNVYIMLDHFDHSTVEATRQLYVAMTRAKRNLVIHYNGNYLDHISTEGLQRIIDKTKYRPAPMLAIQLTLRDVWLDYSLGKQPVISKMISGDELMIDGDILTNKQGQPLSRFSKQFARRLELIKRSGYIPENAKIRSIIYWKKENHEKEIRVILPELYFIKDTSS